MKLYLLNKKKLVVLMFISVVSTNTFSNESKIRLDNVENTGKVETSKGSVELFKNVNVPSDRRAVRYFFSYDCAFSRKYDQTLTKWGETLPKPLKFVRVPVITERVESAFSAVAYYTVLRKMPNRINDFQLQMYKLVQDERKSLTAFETYAEAVYRIGGDVKMFAEEYENIANAKFVNNASLLGAQYQVSHTPTIGVGGKYSFTSEVISPEKGDIIHLSNVIVSKYIAENGLPKK